MLCREIECVFFDMDGVLVDSERGGFLLLQKTLARYGVHAELNELLEYVGKRSGTIAREVVERYSLPMTADDLQKANRQTGNYYADSDELRPMEGLRAFLDKLRKASIKTALVSSTGSRNVLTALNRLSLLPRFDAVVCGDMIVEEKPAPACYLAAAELLHAQPAACMVIEDSPIGIEAGKRAGMFVVGYKGAQYEQDTRNADWEVFSFDELSARFFMQ